MSNRNATLTTEERDEIRSRLQAMGYPNGMLIDIIVAGRTRDQIAAALVALQRTVRKADPEMAATEKKGD